MELDREYAELETDEERVLWLARVGVEPEDIATKLDLAKKLAIDAEYKTRFEDLVKYGAAEMRIEIAKTILSEARVGQVTALTKMASAHLAAFKVDSPSTEFAGSYRAKVDELLARIDDEQHGHVRARFRFGG